MAEIDAQCGLLDRLAAPGVPAGRRRAEPRRAGLRGPAIREAAVRALVADGRDALHYREWFELLDERTVAGKDPLAVFLTQLSRSPAVRKGAQPGRLRARPPRARTPQSRARRPPRATPRPHDRHGPRRHPRAPRAAHGRDRPHREGARGGRARARARAWARGAPAEASRSTCAIIEGADGADIVTVPPSRVTRRPSPRSTTTASSEREATFETRPRQPNEIAGWLDEGRPFLVATDDTGRDPRLRPRLRVLRPHARTPGWGSTASTSTRRRAAATSACS